MDQIIQQWGEAISNSLREVFERFIQFIPNVLAAVVILIIGWLVAVWFAKLVDRLIKISGLNNLFQRFKVEDVLRKTGWKDDVASFFTLLVKWIILIVVFIAATNALNLSQVTDFLNRVLSYSPQVIAAAGIILVGFLLANFLGSITKGAVKAAEIKYADTLGAIVKYAILVFSILAALNQLGIASSLIQILVWGFVAMVALAGGLAFGLGGRDVATEILDRIKKDLSHK